MRTLRNLFVEGTTTVAIVVALTLVGFGFLEATEPRMGWSGRRRERHLIGCPVCCDIRLPSQSTCDSARGWRTCSDVSAR